MKNFSIPVITYHHVNSHRGDTVTVTPEYFEEQLKYLNAKGYQTLFLDELISRLEAGTPQTEKLIALTFDDGYRDNYIYAYPLLKKYKMKATIFMITSLAKDKHEAELQKVPLHKELRPRNAVKEGSSDFYLSWEEMQKMQASGFIDIQPHTHKHRNLTKEKEDAREELALSKKLTEEKLAKKCYYIAWPWGSCDKELVALGKELGFKGGVVTQKGVNITNKFDSMYIKRFDTEKGNIGWLSRKLFIYRRPKLTKFYLALRR